MAEDHGYKFVLRKLGENDTAPSTGAEAPSDPWLNEQDLQCSTPESDIDGKKPSEDISFLYSRDTDEPFEDKDLYSDLVKLEEEEKKAKQNHQMEFEKLKKELEEYRASDAKKERKIDALTRENTNLLKSISSLYRTAKHEMEYKDKLLAAANIQVDIFKQQLMEGKCPRCNYPDSEENRDKNPENKSSQPSSYHYKTEYKENKRKRNF